MKLYPSFVNKENLFSVIGQILELRREDVTDYERLRDSKLKGRERTGVREVPIAFDEVLLGDVIGDTLHDGTYRYTLIDDGAPKWDRQDLKVSWSI